MKGVQQIHGGRAGTEAGSSAFLQEKGVDVWGVLPTMVGEGCRNGEFSRTNGSGCSG